MKKRCYVFSIYYQNPINHVGIMLITLSVLTTMPQHHPFYQHNINMINGNFIIYSTQVANLWCDISKLGEILVESSEN